LINTLNFTQKTGSHSRYHDEEAKKICTQTLSPSLEGGIAVKKRREKKQQSFVAEFQSLIFKAHDPDSMKNAPVEEMRISKIEEIDGDG
jgi:hypothetical protein